MSGSFGDPIRAFGGDPKFKLLSLVKNQALADAASGILSRENEQSGDNLTRLRKFSSRWDASQAQRDAFTDQDVGAIGDIYDGDLGRTLAGNEALAFQRMDDATNVNSLLNAGALKSNAMKMGGSDSGYRMGLALKSIAGLKTQNALAKSGMTIENQRYLTGQQLGNVGRRQGLIDANINDTLIPMQAMNAETARRTGMIGGLTGIDNQNTLYGAQQHKTGLDKWAELGNSLGRISMDAASTYGAAMNGGGAQSQPSPYNNQQQGMNNFGGGGSYFNQGFNNAFGGGGVGGSGAGGFGGSNVGSWGGGAGGIDVSGFA